MRNLTLNIMVTFGFQIKIRNNARYFFKKILTEIIILICQLLSNVLIPFRTYRLHSIYYLYCGPITSLHASACIYWR
jgi:hypothetical protein